MTIKELEKLYPCRKVKWLALRLYYDGTKYPNWNYHDDDEVVDFEYTPDAESVDITDALLNGGKTVVSRESKLFLVWKRVT